MKKWRFWEFSFVIVGMAILFFASGGDAGKKFYSGGDDQAQANRQNILIEVGDGSDFVATVPVNLHNIHPLVRAVVLTASLQNFLERDGQNASGAADGARVTVSRSVVLPRDTDIVRDVVIGMAIPDTYTNSDLPYYDVTMEFEVTEAGDTVYRVPIPADDQRAGAAANRHLTARGGAPLYFTENGNAPQP